MRVLIIPSWYFPLNSNEIGGRMFHAFALGLKEEGIDARILYAEFSPEAPFRKEINVSKEEGIRTYRIRQKFPPRVNSIIIRAWINKYVKAILAYMDIEGRPDLIHAQSYMAGMVCAELYRRTNIPFVLTERVSTFITGKIPLRHKSFIRDCFDSATAITCVSPGLKSHLTKYTKKPIEVFPNFYDPSIFYRDPVAEKYKKFTFLSVGEPAHVKGLDLLLKAYAKVRQKNQDVDMQLILIDRIHEQKQLMNLGKKLKIENEISWAGLISPELVAEIMRHSHILVSASRTETFGKTILEAQACGLPVIATKTDGASYIITSPAQGILIELNNVDELAHSMSEMYLNYTKYHPGSIVAAVKSRFKKDIVMEEWVNFYKRLLA